MKPLKCGNESDTNGMFACAPAVWAHQLWHLLWYMPLVVSATFIWNHRLQRLSGDKLAKMKLKCSRLFDPPRSRSLWWHFLIVALEGENSFEWKSIVAKDAGNTANKEKRPGATTALFSSFFAPSSSCASPKLGSLRNEKLKGDISILSQLSPFFPPLSLVILFVSRLCPSLLPSCCLHTGEATVAASRKIFLAGPWPSCICTGGLLCTTVKVKAGVNTDTAWDYGRNSGSQTEFGGCCESAEGQWCHNKSMVQILFLL